MLVLALDTTSRGGSVAVTREDQVLASLDGDRSRTHGERLPEEIERALAAAGVSKSQIDLLAVGRGPGAFTGLRIGLAAMQGLAMALARPVIGISAFDALAVAVGPDVAAAGDQWLEIWVDAQRGEVFRQRFREAAEEWPHWAPVGEASVDTPALALDAAGRSRVAFTGDGASRYRAEIEGRQGRVLPSPSALAPFMASLAWRRARQGLAGAPHALQPLYIRRPDAELARRGRSAV